MSNTRVIEADLGTLLGAMVASRIGGAEKPSQKRPVAQDVETLKAAAARYAGPVAFKPGDLITPRADSPLAHAGRPHIVLEISDYPVRTFEAPDPRHVDNQRFGAKLDIRVASVCDCDHAEIRPFWEESWMFDAYVEVAPESPAA